MATRLITLILALVALSGCVQRAETIRIEADGTVRMSVVQESDSFDDMYLGDAVPVLERGWLVQQSEVLKEDGEKTYRLEAQAVFPPATPLPSNYAGLRDPRPRTALQFPTSVTFEERDDGTYVHFQRRYEVRPWAFLAAPRAQLQKALEAMAGRELSEMTEPQRRAVIRAAAHFEAQKQLAFARAAYLEVLSEQPQDTWLLVHKALLDAASEIDVTFILVALGEEDRSAGEEMLNAEREGAERRAVDAMRTALRDVAGVPLPAVRSFFDAYDWQRAHFEITEDLGDDKFEITVIMPGTIIGHNGEKNGVNRVRWEFGGDLIRDNAFDLMATSRLR